MASAFEEYFSEPQHFSNRTLVVRGDITRAEAVELFRDYTGDPVPEESLQPDLVRYGFAPEFVEELAGQSCWYTGARSGKGSKPVWVLEL